MSVSQLAVGNQHANMLETRVSQAMRVSSVTACEILGMIDSEGKQLSGGTR
jgi:hypothetical protein